MYAKLKPLSPTKTPGKVSGEPVIGDQQRRRTAVVAEETRASIDSFESRLRAMPVSGSTLPHSSPAPTTVNDTSHN